MSQKRSLHILQKLSSSADKAEVALQSGKVLLDTKCSTSYSKESSFGTDQFEKVVADEVSVVVEASIEGTGF